jgi:hypothetical protein
VEEEEDRFKLWIGFDACGIFTIEEGEMDQPNIIKKLKELFDKEWGW